MSPKMVEIEVKLQKRPSKFGKYTSYAITLPADIIKATPKIKKVKRVKLDTNLLGNIEIKF